MLADAGEIRREVAALFRPARRILPSVAAARSLVDFRTGQNWDPETAPYMCEPLDTMASRLHDSTILIGPSRGSKTFSLVLGGITYIITCDPADTTLIHMNQTESRQFSKSDLARTFDASPDLGSQIGPAAGDDNIEMKLMRNGMALRMGYPSISCVSSKTIRWIFITDADNLTGDLPIDELFPLALKRAQTFLSAGHLVAESNPAVDYVDADWTPRSTHEGPPALGMVALYNSGDRRRYYWPCPHCGERFQAVPGLTPFRLLPGLEELREAVNTRYMASLASKYATVVCTKNGCEIRHDAKREMNLRGSWLREGQTIDRDGVIGGEGLVSKRASFWVAGVMACYQSWQSMVEQYLLAVKKWATTGDESEIKQKLNTDFAWPHIPYAVTSRKQNNALATRSEELLPDHVPAGVRFLTAAVDVQGNRFVILIIGWGVDLQKWVVKSFTLRTSSRKDAMGNAMPINPATYAEDWELLIDEVITRRLPLADGSGRTLPVSFTLIDSGGRALKTGKVTEKAYAFWRLLKSKQLHQTVRLLKGASARDAPRTEERYPGKKKGSRSTAAGDIPVVFINTTTVKDAVAGDLAREVEGQGYWHFPHWLPNDFYREMQSEIRGPKGWEKPDGVANEAFDLSVYNYAAAYQVGADKIKWSHPPLWAAAWDKNPNVKAIDVAEAPKAPARRKLRRAASKYLGR